MDILIAKTIENIVHLMVVIVVKLTKVPAKTALLLY